MYYIYKGEWKCTNKSSHSLSIFETSSVVARLVIKEVNGITNENSFSVQANICIQGSSGDKLSTSSNDVYIDAYSMLVTPSILLYPGKYEIICSLYHSISHGTYELLVYTSSPSVEIK